MKAKILLLASLVFLALELPAEADRDTLNVAMEITVTNLDLTVSTSRQTLVLCHNWAGTLVCRDPKTGELVPCLAESYRFLEPNIIEFHLRKGIRFHNGEPFDARAILNRFFIPGDPLCYGSTAQLAEVLQKANGLTDQSERKTLFSKAQKLIAEEAFRVPLYDGKAVAAMHRDLDYSPSYDGINRFFTASRPQ